MLPVRAWLGLLLLTGSACASAPPKLLGQPIRQPINVLVRVSAEAAASDDGGATAAMVETLTDGLAERGVETRLFLADDDAPPAPRIELSIEEWNTGDVKGRAAAGGVGAAAVPLAGVVGPLAGAIVQLSMAGGYSILCSIYRDGETKPAYVRRYTGSIAGDGPGSGESIGSSVLSAALGTKERHDDPIRAKPREESEPRSETVPRATIIPPKPDND